MRTLIETQNHIDELVNNPSSIYGKEVGTAKLVRDGLSFRIFSKKVEDSSSGKADLVELHVFVKSDNGEERLLMGRTYIPKFAINDEYWIMDNKVDNKKFDLEDMGIDQSYVKVGKYYHTNFSVEQTIEEKVAEHVSFLRHMMAYQYPLVAV